MLLGGSLGAYPDVDCGSTMRATLLAAEVPTQPEEYNDSGVRALVARTPLLLDLDLDVDTGGQFEPLQGVHRFGRGIHDVEQALMDAHLEMLA